MAPGRRRDGMECSDRPSDLRSKRRLGRTPIQVTPMGLGAWQFSEGKGGAWGTWAPLSPDQTDEIVQAALDGGMNWFDTAELYGFGRSERGLARALRRAGKADGDVVIATKWNPLFRTAGLVGKTTEDRLRCFHPS